MQQLNIYEIGKNKHRDVLTNVLKNDPNLMYLEHVDRAHEVSLPLISKVFDNKLVL